MRHHIRAKFFNVLFIVSLLAGCTSDPGMDGLDGLNSLVKVTPEGAGSNCNNGGTKVETGIDKNRDTILDANEIQNSVFICNGVNGTNGATGPSGSNGSNGTNGTNGTNGANGSNGLTSLIKVTPEPAGTNCPASGSKVDTGLDNNFDGVLSSAEISNTVYVCNGMGTSDLGKPILVLFGDVTDSEAAAIIAQDLGSATQQIDISNCPNLTTLDLSALKAAVKIVIEGNENLKTINLSGLKTLTGTASFQELPKIEELNLSSLEYISANLNTEGFAIYGTNLEAISFPALKKSFGPLNIGFYDDKVISNNKLKSISMPLLTNCGDFELNGTSLESISLPLLAKGNLEIAGIMTSLSLPEFVEGEIDISSPTSQTYLTSLQVPKLTTGGLTIVNSSLTTLSAPALQKGSLDLRENPVLTQIILPELIESNRIGISSNPLITSVSLPKLAWVAPNNDIINNLAIGNNDNLTNINFPMLNKIEGDVYISNTNLATISFATFTKLSCSTFQVDQGKLSSGTVNSLLANLVQVSPAITGVTISLTQNPSAPPTGQGIIDKSTLVANNNTVNTD